MDDDSKFHDLNNKKIEEFQNVQPIVREGSQFFHEGNLQSSKQMTIVSTISWSYWKIHVKLKK